MRPWKRLLLALLKLIRFIADFISDIVYKLIYEGNSVIKITRIQDDLLLRPAIKLAELIRTRQVTSVQVTSAFIQRIKNVNGIINAVVDERFDLALLDAKAADEEIECCKNLVELTKAKPFLGVPFTTKDCFQVVGLSHTGGLLKRGQRKEKAKVDADTVAQLRSAGGQNLFEIKIDSCHWTGSSPNGLPTILQNWERTFNILDKTIGTMLSDDASIIFSLPCIYCC